MDWMKEFGRRKGLSKEEVIEETTDGIHMYFDHEKNILKGVLDYLGVSDALDSEQHKTFQRLTHSRCFRRGSKEHMIYERKCRMEEGEMCELCGETRHKTSGCIQKHRMCNYCGMKGHARFACPIWKAAKN